MDEKHGNTSFLRKALHAPQSSVILMVALGALGLSTGYITHAEESAGTVPVSKKLDTAVPNMASRNFKSHKYDNAAGNTSRGEDSLFSDYFTRQQGKAAVSTTADNSGTSTNENLPLDQIARANGYGQLAPGYSRNQVRSAYNQRFNAQAEETRSSIQQLTAPAPLSEWELAERRSQDAALERAAQLEQRAIQQMENANRRRKRSNSAREDELNGSDEEQSAMDRYRRREAPGDSPTPVMVANLDEYVAGPGRSEPQNSFFGLKGERKKPEMVSSKPIPNAIEAVIHGDADNITVTTGSTLKLRLLEPIQVGKYMLPTNTILTGECGIGGERVYVMITSIRIQSSIIPVKLHAYDIDGHEGLYVPNMALKNQVAQTGAQTVTGGSFSMPYVIPSGGNVGEMMIGQAASQGVNLVMNGARSIAAQKISQQKGTIRPNYKVYLKQDQD